MAITVATAVAAKIASRQGMCVCVCACVRACVRACVCACACACACVPACLRVCLSVCLSGSVSLLVCARARVCRVVLPTLSWGTSPSPEGWPAPAPRDSELGLPLQIKLLSIRLLLPEDE
jgi:hypothetical protein